MGEMINDEVPRRAQWGSQYVFQPGNAGRRTCLEFGDPVWSFLGAEPRVGASRGAGVQRRVHMPCGSQFQKRQCKLINFGNPYSSQDSPLLHVLGGVRGWKFLPHPQARAQVLVYGPRRVGGGFPLTDRPLILCFVVVCLWLCPQQGPPSGPLLNLSIFHRPGTK